MWYRIGTRVWALERNKTDGWNWHVLIDIMKFKCNCLNGRRQNAESYNTSNSIKCKITIEFHNVFRSSESQFILQLVRTLQFHCTKKQTLQSLRSIGYYIILCLLVWPFLVLIKMTAIRISIEEFKFFQALWIYNEWNRTDYVLSALDCSIQFVLVFFYSLISGES